MSTPTAAEEVKQDPPMSLAAAIGSVGEAAVAMTPKQHLANEQKSVFEQQQRIIAQVDTYK